MDTNHAVEEKTYFGFWLYLLSDILLFASLFATYGVLTSGTAGGLGPRQLVPLPTALAETLLLLVSSFVCSLTPRRKKGWVMVGLAMTLALGCLFIGMVGSDFARLIQSGNSWERSAYLSAYFVLVGTLLFHMVMGLLWVLVLLGQIAQRGITDSTYRRTVCFKMFWCFLNVIWVAIYHWVYL